MLIIPLKKTKQLKTTIYWFFYKLVFFHEIFLVKLYQILQNLQNFTKSHFHSYITRLRKYNKSR